MGGISYLDPMTLPSMCGTCHHTPRTNSPPLVTQSILVCVHSPTQVGGSETQRMDYYIGYPQTVIQACIHLRSSRFPLHLTPDRFHSILRTFCLEPLGPKFSTMQNLELSFGLCTFVFSRISRFFVIALAVRSSLRFSCYHK